MNLLARRMINKMRQVTICIHEDMRYFMDDPLIDVVMSAPSTVVSSIRIFPSMEFNERFNERNINIQTVERQGD